MKSNDAKAPEGASQLPWDEAIARLLEDLSTVQTELLAFLDEKRRSLVAADLEAMAASEPQERRLIERLEACQQTRGELLERAAREGLPADSLRAIAAALPETGSQLKRQLTEAQARSRLLHHHSLTNWVLVQRTLIHLSQMLEIIATGGRGRPTYEKGGTAVISGSLVDHAA